MEDAAAERYENAQRENSTLKAKLKVLVDKIEEYRASEDAMRMTLLSAQKLSNQIEAEARERADKLLSDAQAKANEILGSLQDEREAEQQRLDASRAALERFFSDAREVCEYTMESLKRLEAGELPSRASSAPSVDETVRSISESVERLPDEPEPKIDVGVRDGRPHARARLLRQTTSRAFSTWARTTDTSWVAVGAALLGALCAVY